MNAASTALGLGLVDDAFAVAEANYLSRGFIVSPFRCTKAMGREIGCRLMEVPGVGPGDMPGQLGREPINLPGGRLARVRYAPIATKFCSATKMTRWANNRGAGRFAGDVFPRVRLGTSNSNSFCQLL